MKEYYENRYRLYLTRRTPAIIRLDGKSFHTLAKNLRRPFDDIFIYCMEHTAMGLMNNIQGAEIAYVQSDEISIFIKDYNRLNSEAWFGYNIQKISSVSASMATYFFNCYWRDMKDPIEGGFIPLFDARVFNIPKEEISNYFLWRQRDWERNSLNMLCEQYFSHNELENKNSSDRHEMLHSVGVNWADLDDEQKNGTFLYKTELGIIYNSTNIVSQDREFIEERIKEEE